MFFEIYVSFFFHVRTLKLTQIILPLPTMTLNKNILVTGGAGFIGSHTVIKLIELGFSPYILDDFRNSERKVIDRIEKLTGVKPPVFSIDISDKDLLNNKLKGIQFAGVIHFAAYKAVGESVAEPLKYYRNNILGLLNIVEFCEENNILNLVFSSSCTVYGEPENEKCVSEDANTKNPNSPYGFTKVVGEQLLRDVHQSGAKLKALSLRYFNPIGAHPSGLIGELPIGKPNNLIPYVTQTGAGILEKLTIYGHDYPTEDGTCKRDYIHVCDLADAHLKGLDFLMNRNKPLIEFVNVGTGEGTSTLEVVKIFERISGKKLNWVYGPRRDGDVAEIFSSSERSLSLLGWKAELNTEDAIKDAWNWQLKQNDEV